MGRAHPAWLAADTQIDRWRERKCAGGICTHACAGGMAQATTAAPQQPDLPSPIHQTTRTSSLPDDSHPSSSCSVNGSSPSSAGTSSRRWLRVPPPLPLTAGAAGARRVGGARTTPRAPGAPATTTLRLLLLLPAPPAPPRAARACTASVAGAVAALIVLPGPPPEPFPRRLLARPAPPRPLPRPLSCGNALLLPPLWPETLLGLWWWQWW